MKYIKLLLNSDTFMLALLIITCTMLIISQNERHYNGINTHINDEIILIKGEYHAKK